MMGLNESKHIWNLDLIEQFDTEVEQNTKEVENTDNFSNSAVQNVVWRAGEMKLYPSSGGLWFGDSKDGVEKFALSVRGQKREGKPYYINLLNPYFIENGFWRGYVDMVSLSKGGRESLMRSLMKKGHDGIIINDDWWNDTGDENAVYGKQFIIFDEKNVKPA